ncbi:MAG TPA: apolipoprotein N-acyltransferase [Bacteroidales bacterium]|nr:apolipoprotein N-acyltransferase [Bacteroidales bacterium]
MNKYFLTALSVTGGVITGLAWSGWCTGLVLLFSLVPFFIIENYLYVHKDRYSANAFFIYLLPGFVLFSIAGIGWMRVASLVGAICVIMGLAFLMSFALWLAHVVRLKAGNYAGIIALFSFWLAYEFISLNVNIVSPWLNLGNGLAKDILFIQWYDLTGTSGGTVWIMASNLLLSVILLMPSKNRKRRIIVTTAWIAVVLIPSGFSLFRYFTVKENHENPAEVVIVQPDTDPYTEKYNVPFRNQLQNVINMATGEASASTSWIITPETTVDDPVNQDSMNYNKYIIMLRDLAGKYPQASIVSGLVTYLIYPPSDIPPTKSARRIDLSGAFYDHFNSAVKIDTSDVVEIYHKSKLVPGIEMQFSNGPGRLISRILPYLGGTKWGYGVQKERLCFNANHGSLKKVGPVICYESVFGQYVTGYVKNGAEALFIITNDGWWKNTNGYKQHLWYASLRAIETRRPVARSANTGVSCFIDIRGKRLSETKWWTKAVLKGYICPETRITPYVKYGDYLLRIGSLAAVAVILIIFIAIPYRKKIRTY